MYVSREQQLARRLTGLPAATHQLLSASAVDGVRCGRCATRLEAGQRIAVLARHYRGRTWEPVAYRCPAHADEIDVTAAHDDSQALARATLEPTGTHDPIGGFDPDALTLGDVDVKQLTDTNHPHE